MVATINADTTNGVVITSDTSGEIELQSNGVTKAKVTANGLQDANGNSLRGGMYRNLIRNGDMQIAQRGTSSTSSGYYTVDGWYSGDVSASNTITQSQEADAPSNQGLYYSHKNLLTSTSTATAARLEAVQRLEAQFIRHSGWNHTSATSYLTLSFWVKSNVTGTYYTLLRTEDGTAKSINKSYTITSANTWEKKTITISGDSSLQIDNNNGRGMSLWTFYIANTDTTDNALSNLDAWGTFNSSGYTPDSSTASTFLNTSGAYISVTGVQLEVGSGASDFEFLPYDVQLQRCQRYYIQYNQDKQSYGHISIGGLAASTTQCRHALAFPVTMRAVPSVSFDSIMVNDGVTITAVTSVNTVGNQTSRENGFIHCIVASGLTQYRPYQLQVNNNVNGYLAYSAEV
jgi:hypothetical protein